MKLDYGTQLSPAPISLSIGTVKKPTLEEISKITFGRFYLYEALMNSTPQEYYGVLMGDIETSWSTMSEEERSEATMMSMIQKDKELQNLFTDMFNFFIEEDVHYLDGLFIIMKPGFGFEEQLNTETIQGIIHKGNFDEILDVFQQICCIWKEEEKPPKFKNKKAREIYEKIQRGKKKEADAKKKDMNLSIPNIISAVASKHSSLNLGNIWSLTIFQLLDSFNRLQSNAVYDIDSMRVSAWGDEKKTFDIALWYKNYYDKNDRSK